MFTSRESTREVRSRTFCRTDRRVTVASEVKSGKLGAEAKASLKRAREFGAVDPKPGDLSMGRLKWK